MQPFHASLLGVIVLSAGVAGTATAQPTLSSSLTDWGNISIYGPAVTRSGGARTEIVGQRTEWDHDSNGVFNPPADGHLVQNVWTEASVVGGAPVFRSYHDLKGDGIPLYNGAGWTGFRTDAGYIDTWTITVLALPIGAALAPVFSFGLVSHLGDLFPPGGAVALPANFYPYNPLWGSVPPGVPVVGPLPAAPSVDLFMSIDNYRWYDYKNTPGNTATTVAMGGAAISAGPLAVQNGVPFAVQIDFIAGWRIEHSDVVSIIGPTFEHFSTNAVFDASHTGALSAVTVYDESGALQQGWSLFDSQGTAITPISLQVAEPQPLVLFLVGGLAVLARAHRRCPVSRVFDN